jgi:hypothetical protein
MINESSPTIFGTTSKTFGMPGKVLGATGKGLETTPKGLKQRLTARKSPVLAVSVL